MTDARQHIPVSTQHIRLPIDSATGALLVLDNSSQNTVDNTTYNILQSKVFHVADAETVGNTNGRSLLLTTPNTAMRIHLSFKIGANGNVQYFFYEDPTISDVGTAVTPYNRDRNSAATATLTVKHTPAVTSVGTAISKGNLVISNNINSERIEDRMWILKQNEQYLLRVVNNSGASVYTTILVDWYEE